MTATVVTTTHSRRPWRAFLTARGLSMFGDNINLIAVTFAVLEATHSATSVGIVLGARAATAGVTILIGGVWADQWSRRTLMLGADIARFVSQAILAWLVIRGDASLGTFVALQVVHGLGTAVFQPAAGGIVPLLVDPDERQRANGFLATLEGCATFLGPALGGALVAAAGAGWAIGIDAVTFLLSAVCLLFVGHLPPADDGLGKRSMLAGISEGWRVVASRRWMQAGLGNMAAFQVLVLAPLFVLGPLIASTDWRGATSWGIVLGVFGAGSIVGAIAAGRLHFHRPLVATLTAMLVFVPVLLLLADGAHVVAVGVAMFAGGAAMAFSEVLWDTTVQQTVPNEVLGRVSSIEWLMFYTLYPIGLFLAGAVASGVGESRYLQLGAVLFGLATLLGLALRSVRTLTAPAPAPAPTHDAAS